MPDNFVPMAPIAKSAAGGNGNAFTPLEFRAGASTSAGKAPLGPVGSPAPSPALHDCANPKVTLQRQGDTVTSIRVECPCGQVIELKCVY
ncbi:MAG: hypothetical protein ABSA47_13700 [Verrucomicrobiota bacterium]|jgi:hypothetical protein